VGYARIFMADYMKQLREMVPPPAEIFEVGDRDSFAKVEAELGLMLPEDYKQVVQTYGSGQWQGFWYILNPFTQNEFLNFVCQSKMLRPKNWSTLDSERERRESTKGIYPYPNPIYPEPGGIIPWALTDNGGRFFWLTKTRPEDWPTIYYPDRSPDFIKYPVSCAELLFKAVAGILPIFAEEFGNDYEYGRPDAFLPIKPRQ
jgi:hypothetical protein